MTESNWKQKDAADVPLCPALGWWKKWAPLGQPHSAPEGKGEKWESWNFPYCSPGNKELQGWGSGDPWHHWPENPPIFQRVGTQILNKPRDFSESGVPIFLLLLWSLCSMMGTLSRILFISSWKSNRGHWSWTSQVCNTLQRTGNLKKCEQINWNIPIIQAKRTLGDGPGV